MKAPSSSGTLSGTTGERTPAPFLMASPAEVQCPTSVHVLCITCRGWSFDRAIWTDEAIPKDNRFATKYVPQTRAFIVSNAQAVVLVFRGERYGPLWAFSARVCNPATLLHVTVLTEMT